MIYVQHIFRTRADTRRIIFHLVSKDSPKGISLAGWSSPSLIVDPNEFPLDNTANVANLIGTVTDVTNGRISFIPLGDIPAGNYFYNARAFDGDGGRFTFARGKFIVTEDI